MKILLVEPEYYTRYPPLGLLKWSSFHKARGNEVRLVRGRQMTFGFIPDEVYITSLFTWAWRPVHEACSFYKALFPDAFVKLGGIYASLMKDHAETSKADAVHAGTVPNLDRLVPDYSLIPDWDANILFSSRGCIRKCPFCAVPALEPEKTKGMVIGPLSEPKFKRYIFWDNNVLGEPHWKDLADELRAMGRGISIDFNQGLDARLVTEEVAEYLKGLRINPIRLAFDYPGMGRQVKAAIERLSAVGFRKRRMSVYVLYNYWNSPDAFFSRVRDLLRWGVVAYPMRYEPLDSLQKGQYVAENKGWTAEALNLVAKARRVLGWGGAFPPTKALVDKFEEAESFEEAFALRPIHREDPGVLPLFNSAT